MTDLTQDVTVPDNIAAEVAAWEDPPRASSAVSAPVLAVDGFEGPLDWLLEMVRARQIDLARLSVVALVEAFAGAMDNALARQDNAPAQLVRWGDWLVMAATLAHLRSRRLLPADSPEARAAVGQAEALRRQLVGRAQMQTAAAWLERQPQLGRDVFQRGAPEGNMSCRIGDITDLLRACLVALAVPAPQASALRRRQPLFWRVPDAIAHIEYLLRSLPEGGPLAIFLPEIAGESVDRALRYRAAVSSTLIASLELARDGALAVDQDAAWRPIRLNHRNDRHALSGEAGRRV
jgi:segregation and condensation protein A